MAKTIRVSKDMRSIIDFYKSVLESKGLEISSSLTDAAIVEALLRSWLYENYTVREADDILN